MATTTSVGRGMVRSGLVMALIGLAIAAIGGVAGGQDDQHAIQVDDVSETTISVSWADSGASYFGVAWWPLDYSSFQSALTFENSFTITGLQADTTYTVQVDGVGSRDVATLGTVVVQQQPQQQQRQQQQQRTISIVGGGDVSEGNDGGTVQNATFTITLTPAPTSSHSVVLKVAQTGDVVDASHLGQRPAISITSGTHPYTYSVPLKADDDIEGNGSVTVSVVSLDGNTQTGISASVIVLDDDWGTRSPGLQAEIKQWIAEARDDGQTEETTLLRRALYTVGGVDPPDGLTAMTIREAYGRTAHHYQAGQVDLRQSDRWQKIVTDLRKDAPQVSISDAHGPGVEEGDKITFTVTLDRDYTEPFPVFLALKQKGEYADPSISGSATCTLQIPAGTTVKGYEHQQCTVAKTDDRNYTVTVDTDNDKADEADGSISLIVTPYYNGPYRVGSPGFAAVAVADNDMPTASMPAVTISADSLDVNEGDSITLTLTADRSKTSPFSVTVNLTQVEGFLGSQSLAPSVMFLSGETTKTLIVSTTRDNLGSADGWITASIADGDGTKYIPGITRAVTIKVRDLDATGPLDLRIKQWIVTARDHGVWHVAQRYRRALAASRNEGGPLSCDLSDSACAQKELAWIDSRIAHWEGISGGGKEVTLWNDIKASVQGHTSMSSRNSEDESTLVASVQQQIQERIDLTASNGDRWSNRIWRGALAAVRGESPTGDARLVDQAFAQRLANGHDRGGRSELSDLWQSIADELSP